MSIRNLDKIFRPQSVALVGASRNERSVGYVTLRNLLGGGFAGPVWPVNPNASELLSHAVYAGIADLPGAPDLAIIATPPASVPGLVGELAARGTRGIVVLSAGFGELGVAGRQLQADLLAAARPHLARIVGPNGLGTLTPPLGLNASFAHLTPRSGGLALVAQSGAIITSLLDWAHPRGLGFSLVASLGDMADVDFGDMLDYLAHDRETHAVLLYIEQVTQARKFMSAARALSRLKPVIVVKAGRSEQGARAAASHTGALAGSDSVHNAAFQRAGMIRVLTLDELFDAAETLSRVSQVGGERLTILTNGGGVGVLATDAAFDEGVQLAELSAVTRDALDAVLPRTWSRGNPVDIIGDAGPQRYAAAVSILARAQETDALLIFNCPTAVADSLEAARSVAQASKDCATPVLTSWLGAETAEQSRRFLSEAGLPTYETPEKAVHAFGHLVRHRRNQALLLEVPHPSETVSVDTRRRARGIIAAALGAGAVWLPQDQAVAVLAAYGIPVVPTRFAATPAEAASAAQKIGGRVALKIRSDDITHKSDVGGVALGLAPDQVERAGGEMLSRVRAKAAAARISGFSVQAMIERPGAIELLVGLTTDQTFGPVIVFGQGGTSVEVVRDKAIALPPMNDVLARDLISRTRVFALLKGYRDRPAADESAIISTLLKIAEIAADIPEILDIDINPLLADASGVIALDSRIRVAVATKSGAERFAILPYPRELEQEISDRNGNSYFLRPIKPEDAPALAELIEKSDPGDVRFRFFRAVKTPGAELSRRLTQIDYDREMCFAAFDDAGSMLGVARLYSDPDRDRAEYTLFVRTDHQGSGLGFRLMEEVLTYARKRGIREVFGDVLQMNKRMLTMCNEFGFSRHAGPGDASVVEVRLALRQATP